MREQKKPYYEFGTFRFDMQSRQLFRITGEPVPLTKKLADLLSVFLERKGEVLSKETLWELVWPEQYGEVSGMENVRRTVSRLREALDDNEALPTYIQTMPWRGYKFIFHVNTPPQVESLAVLPFRPLSAAAVEPHRGLVIADALITRLSTVGAVVVRPTSSIRKYVDLDIDPIDAGRALMSTLVLDGTLQSQGEQTRVTVQLLRVSDGNALWAGKFDSSSANIFRMQDEITEKIAEALVKNFTGDERKPLVRADSSSPEAIELYYRGLFYWNKRGHEDIERGMRCFEQAIQQDTFYAPPYAKIADSFILLSSFGTDVLPPKDAMPKARDAALKALERDETLAEAHTSLGAVKALYDWNLAEAEKSFKKAIHYNPSYETAHHWYGNILTAIGRFEEAAEQLTRAREINPNSLIIRASYGWLLYFARNYAQAIEHCKPVVDMDPSFINSHIYWGLASRASGDLDTAIKRFQSANKLAPDNPAILSELGHAYALSGNKRNARKTLLALAGIKNRYVSPFNLARIYVGLRDIDAAFTFLDIAVEERSCWLIYLGVDPLFDYIRGDKRFQELMRRVSFVPQ